MIRSVVRHQVPWVIRNELPVVRVERDNVGQLHGPPTILDGVEQGARAFPARDMSSRYWSRWHDAGSSCDPHGTDCLARTAARGLLGRTPTAGRALLARTLQVSVAPGIRIDGYRVLLKYE